MHPTILDIIKRNNGDAEVGLIDETIQDHPELMLGAARTIKGTGYDTRVRVELPHVGFRQANQGVEPSRSRSELRRVNTHIIDGRFEVDKAVADQNEDGPMAYLAEEGEAQMQAAFKTVAKQFYYGAANDPSGHPGLIDLYDKEILEVDATGDDANKATSVWGVKWGPQAVRFVLGVNGKLDVSEPRIETIMLPDPDDGDKLKKLDGYVQTLLAYIGLQAANIKSVGRIKNITDQAGKRVTDDLIAKLLTKFHEANGTTPDVLFMTPAALEQLRTSRTATNATGSPAPVPTESFNIPIKWTNSILNTEAIEP